MLGPRMLWHSLVVAFIPTVLSAALLIHYRRELQGNWIVFLLSVVLSIAQGRPEIQNVYAAYGRTEAGLFAHGMPFFVVIYLFFGRFDLPSIPLTWAGTYIGLLVTDLAFNYFQWRLGPYDLPILLSGIGGGGWLDGLVVLPIAAVGVTLFARRELMRGHVFWSMVGRRRFMAARQTIPPEQHQEQRPVSRQ